jgi:TatD DNase family protein
VLVDTHCHLDFKSFDPDRLAVVARAMEAGVGRIVNPGIDLASSQAAVKLAQEEAAIYAAVGVHPNDALSWRTDTRAELKGLAGDQKVVAIGEIGLDYYRDRAPRALQREIFREQLALAAELGLPVIIHNREATEDVLGILGDWHSGLQSTRSPLTGRPGVLHSYADSEEPARRAMDLNFFIGFTGPVTFRNAAELQRVAAALPLDRLLVETDAPFLTPHPHRGKRNEPAYVRLVVEKIAELKEMSFSTVADRTADNAALLFDW